MTQALVALLITILVVGLVLGLAIYAIRRLTIVPAEFRQMAEMIAYVLAIIVIVVAALPLMGLKPW